MPKSTIDLPRGLRGYHFHGLDISYSGESNIVLDCPACGKQGKFSIEVETGVSQCWVCRVNWNLVSFIRWLWSESFDRTPNEAYTGLAKSRGLLPETLWNWGVVRSFLNDRWLLPGYDIKGELQQLYTYEQGGRPFATPTLNHGLLYPSSAFNRKASTIYVCEGPWDGMALWEHLGRARLEENPEPSRSGAKRIYLVETASRERSLLADGNVVAVPGAKVFRDAWLPLFAGKQVNLLYDSDHPKEKQQTPTGLVGMEHAVRVLVGADPPPRIRWIQWGRDGYAAHLPDGFDVSDALRSTDWFDL